MNLSIKLHKKVKLQVKFLRLIMIQFFLQINALDAKCVMHALLLKSFEIP